MAIGECEVGWVVWHGVALGLDAKAHVAEREIGICRFQNHNALYRVTLVSVHGFQGVVQLHISIQRIILRTRFLFRDGIVKGCRHVHLVWEEFTQFHIRGERVGLVIFLGACGNTVFQTTKSLRDNLSREVHSANIGELDVKGSGCCPAALGHHIHQS